MILDELQGRRLAGLARDAIAHALGAPDTTGPTDTAFQARAGTFVTLRRLGDLHGCVGNIEPRGTLLEDVRKNAVAAALFDPRSSPITLADVPSFDVELSLLSPLEPMRFDGTEEGARRALVPFRDGVVLRLARAQATFLPQVWESLPNAGDFLRHLKQKAGLQKDFWSPEIELSRYTVRKWIDPRGGAS